jgi:hypothetical protein
MDLAMTDIMVDLAQARSTRKKTSFLCEGLV